MADNVQFQSTQLATPASGTVVSTDEAASGQVQRVKLAYSANGADTHVTADGDGLLVNLGTNNDVTVTGTVTATQSGTWNINNVAGTISLPTGAATETSVAAVAATASGSNLRVTMANPLPTTSSAAMVTSVAASASSVQLLASNDARRGFAIFNDSGASCYIRFGTTASTTTFTVRLDGNAFFESGATIYTGRIDAIWSTASGSARITEW